MPSQVDGIVPSGKGSGGAMGGLTAPRRCGSTALMCGRYALTATPAEVADLLSLDALDGFPPRYNIAPMQPILVVLGGRDVRPEAPTSRREGLLVRWGFLPGWLKDPSTMSPTFNVRAETAAEKPSFRGALRHRRCLVPATGFYEWRRGEAAAKGQPYHVRPRAGGPIVFAGLVETWHAADGSQIDTAAILTTAANGPLSAIHHRMPVTIRPGDIARWLDCRHHEPRDVADLLQPAGEDVFEAIAVSDLVNKVAHTSPDVQAPFGEKARPATSFPNVPAQGRLF